MGWTRQASLSLIAALCVVLLTLAPLSTVASSAASPDPPSTSWGATAQAPCDPLGGGQCMLPFPSDYYTVADKAMPTGRRVHFPPGAFPTSTHASGPVSTAAW